MLLCRYNRYIICRYIFPYLILNNFYSVYLQLLRLPHASRSYGIATAAITSAVNLTIDGGVTQRTQSMFNHSDMKYIDVNISI